MRNFKVKVAAAATVAGMAMSLTACSSSSPEENTAAACTAYGAFASALQSAQTTMSSSATVGEIKAARDTLSSTYQTFTDALGEVAKDRQDDVNAAWEKLDGAVNDISDDQSVADATGSLTDEFAGVKTAQEEAFASLNCG